MKSTTERKCPRCHLMKPLSDYLCRGNDAHSIKMNRVGEHYGRCKTCRHSERDGDPRLFLATLINGSHARRTLSGPTKITTDHLLHVLQMQRGICPLTGLKLSFTRGSGRVWTNASIDRIDTTIGYEQGNVRLVTYWANLARNSLDDDDFIYFCSLVARRFATAP